MLQYIDSAAGFVMIMLTVSLIIMVIMQAVSSLLDLRGRNLVWAMEQLFKQISPDTRRMEAKIDKTKSTFSVWTRLLRARFEKISVAEEIAHAIANDPALVANRTVLANAIRPGEIGDVLRAIKDGKGRKPFEQLDDQVQAQITALLQIVEDERTHVQAVNVILSEIDALVPAQAAAVKTILTQAVDATSNATFEKVMAAVRTKAADKAEAIENSVRSEIQKVTVLEQGMEKWFSTVMDHASTRFTKHNRLWTMIIAVALTLFFRIDSMEVFKQIFSNPDLRAKLVSAAQGATNQAEEILERQHLGTQALEELIAQGKVSDKTRTILTQAPLPARDRCTDGAAYLRTIPATAEEIMAFNTICEEKQKAIIGGANADIKQLTDRLASQELSVFNEVKWPAPFGDREEGWSGLWNEFLVHARGLVLTVLLLSLGAPFWFDALKGIVSLRPTIAGKVDKETGA